MHTKRSDRTLNSQRFWLTVVHTNTGCCVKLVHLCIAVAFAIAATIFRLALHNSRDAGRRYLRKDGFEHIRGF